MDPKNDKRERARIVRQYTRRQLGKKQKKQPTNNAAAASKSGPQSTHKQDGDTFRSSDELFAAASGFKRGFFYGDDEYE